MSSASCDSCNSPASPLCPHGAYSLRNNGTERLIPLLLKSRFVLLLYKGDVEQVCLEHNMSIALFQQITEVQLHRVINHHEVVLIA